MDAPVAAPVRASAAPTVPSVETPYATGEARARRSVPVIPIVAGVVLLVGILGGLWWWSGRDDREMQAGRAAYRSGQTDVARTHFTSVARNDPDRAEPHIYLARMARDEGNLPGALSELQTAIRLEPKNALAMREMGAYLYTVGRYDLARNFYIRALEVNPTDKEALGYLGCSLLRLGRPLDAQKFLQRAGQGGWSSCAQQVMAPQPGMLPQQPGVAYPRP
jgi:tetratricopeptide (TPR) repeat protein